MLKQKKWIEIGKVTIQCEQPDWLGWDCTLIPCKRWWSNAWAGNDW